MVAADVRSANRSSCCSPGSSPRTSLEPVLDIAAGAVDLLVQGARVDLGGWKRGDDKARIGAFGQMLGLGDDPARAAPAVQRLAAGLGNGAPTPFRRPSRRSRRSGAPGRPGRG